MKTLLKPSIYWLIIFFPIAIFLEYNHAQDPYVFFAAALSIIPIAKLIGAATESLAHYTGDAVGGLLNATFGNAPELIIALVALKAGLHEMVLGSLVGTILANLLLALGLSFLIGGLKFHNQEYNPVSMRIYSSMMMIAVLSLMVPSIFHRFIGDNVPLQYENKLNISLSILLLVAYGLYLVFMLKTHADFFESTEPENGQHEEKPWPLSGALFALVGASLLAAFMSEILVGAVEGTGQALGMSRVFIGVIIVSIVGGAAESISAIVMASKNKMDLSIGIALGSSIQISLFVAPMLVLLSTVIGPGQMNLSFSGGLIGAMFFSVLIGTLVAGDGRSNWYKGVQLIIVYKIFAVLFYFMP